MTRNSNYQEEELMHNQFHATLAHPRHLLAAAFALCFLVDGPVAAEGRWQARLLATQIESGSGFSTGSSEEFLTLEPGNDLADAVGIDYRLSPRFGVGLEVVDSALDLDIDVRLDGLAAHGSSRFDFTLISLGLDIDLTATGGFGLSIGPVVAWADYGDAIVDLPQVDAVGNLGFDDEITYGVRLRADVPIGRWSILAGVEYFEASARSNNADLDLEIDIAIDPTLYLLGAGFRF